MYSRSDKIVLVRRVFDRMGIRNLYAWTAMINGYVQNGDSSEAFVHFQDMQFKGGITPNRLSVISVLPGCSSFAGLMGGKQIHGYVIRNQLNSDSSMMSGYGLHGKGHDAVVLYDKMLQLGIKPGMVTVVGVLSACNRSGLVMKGLEIYHSAINDYGIEPSTEICACVVDLLGQSGLLHRALDLLKQCL
ncbi:Pentatricopeptide repeat [Dillenia turbinata]|uniref:Pentatricopeptide repeat n=1 Tax=Dillenia turbinata TaxID=194707 RepID=A0AAN8UEX8_9MAGN